MTDKAPITAGDVASRYRDDTRFMRAVQDAVNAAEAAIGRRIPVGDERWAMLITAGIALWHIGSPADQNDRSN